MSNIIISPVTPSSETIVVFPNLIEFEDDKTKAVVVETRPDEKDTESGLQLLLSIFTDDRKYALLADATLTLAFIAIWLGQRLFTTFNNLKLALLCHQMTFTSSGNKMMDLARQVCGEAFLALRESHGDWPSRGQSVWDVVSAGTPTQERAIRSALIIGSFFFLKTILAVILLRCRIESESKIQQTVARTQHACHFLFTSVTAHLLSGVFLFTAFPTSLQGNFNSANIWENVERVLEIIGNWACEHPFVVLLLTIGGVVLVYITKYISTSTILRETGDKMNGNEGEWTTRRQSWQAVAFDMKGEN
ncbi:hypothetical protein T439DRAFT_381638 [Meredithblackwellia eburnea MCA 4105]